MVLGRGTECLCGRGVTLELEASTPTSWEGLLAGLGGVIPSGGVREGGGGGGGGVLGRGGARSGGGPGNRGSTARSRASWGGGGGGDTGKPWGKLPGVPVSHASGPTSLSCPMWLDLESCRELDTGVVDTALCPLWDFIMEAGVIGS